jgi:hypothetical protein
MSRIICKGKRGREGGGLSQNGEKRCGERGLSLHEDDADLLDNPVANVNDKAYSYLRGGGEHDEREDEGADRVREVPPLVVRMDPGGGRGGKRQQNKNIWIKY